MRISNKKSHNKRDEGLLAQLLSVNNLLRAIVLMGFFSLFVNILYYSRLPTRKTSTQHHNDGNNGNNNGATLSIINKSNNVKATVKGAKNTFQGELVGGQLIKKDKRGREVFHAVTALEVKGLESDGGDEEKLAESMTLEEASVGREKILEHLREAGITEFDVATVLKLPTQEQVERLYGKGPVVYGLDRCDYFQQHIPKDDASVGSAGIFNSGTNTLAMYLNANCIMPDNKKEKYGGMRWQVPWGKHMLADRKWTNTPRNDRKVNKANVMPVVAIRDPYTWMKSMCKHPYAAKWHHSEKHCPNLIPNQDDWDLFPYLENTVPVRIKYPGEPAQWDSLAHLWNDWNGQYFHADYPRLMVRFEDLLFNVKEMVGIVCKCAGAVPREEGKFAYIVDDAKFGPGHPGSHSNLISAMIKYGSEKKRYDGMTKEDLRFAYEALDPEMMMAFQYSMPPPP